MNKFISSITSVFSSLLVIVGITSCCGTPILAAIVSLSGLGSSQISFLAEYQPYFLLLAAISLIIGFYQMYFKKKSNSCCSAEPTGDSTSKDTKAKSTGTLVHKIILWASAVILIVVLFQVKNTKQDVPADSCCTKVEIKKAKNASGNCCPKKEIEKDETAVKNCCPKKETKKAVRSCDSCSK